MLGLAVGVYSDLRARPAQLSAEVMLEAVGRRVRRRCAMSGLLHY